MTRILRQGGGRPSFSGYLRGTEVNYLGVYYSIKLPLSVAPRVQGYEKPPDNKWALAALLGIVMEELESSPPPVIVHTSYKRGRPWPVMATWTPDSVLELLQQLSFRLLG
ncbi:hypothetical protein AVEN_246937-1 [Araneus ventricosus]|uniref:Uncharacterized protein n=1 Tax=Araneus ventricosus TaxID=182803 RepID=A0A4Y2RZ58_ARAVE|nr:hypothetical protein AVEN_246937-1 [Araneus ventricosus]